MKLIWWLFILFGCQAIKEKGFEVHLPIPLPYSETPVDALPSNHAQVLTYRW
jgi:hypothetical protein